MTPASVLSDLFPRVKDARERVRQPSRNLEPCAGCEGGCYYDTEHTYNGIVVGTACEIDGTCWLAEAEASWQEENPPLWVLWLPNGKPNYADGREAEAYLKESGWLRWSAKHNSPEPGFRKGPWPMPWEEWIALRDDPRRVAPDGSKPEVPIYDATSRRRDETNPMVEKAQALLDEGWTIAQVAGANYLAWDYKAPASLRVALVTMVRNGRLIASRLEQEEVAA